MKNNKLIYDFETGSKYTSQTSSIPLQIGIIPEGGSYSSARTTHFHPSLFKKDDGSRYSMDDLMFQDSEGTWQWRQDTKAGVTFASASEKGHKISAGSFREGLDLTGKKIPILQTQEELTSFLSENIKGKHLSGFNSAGYDSFYLAKLLGASDDAVHNVVQNLAKRTDIGRSKGATKEQMLSGQGAVGVVQKLLEKRLGISQQDVMNDLDDLVFGSFRDSDGKFDYSGATLQAERQGLGGRKNKDWAHFFLGKENVDEDLLHDAGYDVYITGRVKQGAEQLKKDVASVRAAMAEGDNATLAKFYNASNRSKIFGLGESFADEIAAMKKAAEVVGPIADSGEELASMTKTKIQKMFENVQGGTKWFSKQSKMKKAGIIGGGLAVIKAGQHVADKLTQSSEQQAMEEERKKRAMEQRLYRDKPGSFVEY